MGIKDSYDHLMIESEIIPTAKWPLIHNPVLIILITIGYLYFILYAGPRYMKDRPSFKLKTFIMFYNLFQIFANMWIVKEHIAAGWFTKYGIQCSPPEINSPSALHIFNVGWWILLLKMFDYIETCIFVLRKKQNQVTFLHVYHHISVVFFGWYFFKYIGDERASLLPLVNCFIHVLMYTYYFIAGWSKELQQLVSPFKRYVTRLQMAQFIGLILYILQVFLPNCVMPKQKLHIVPVFGVNLLIYLGLFYNFYTKSYNKENPKEKEK